MPLQKKKLGMVYLTAMLRTAAATHSFFTKYPPSFLWKQTWANSHRSLQRHREIL